MAWVLIFGLGYNWSFTIPGIYSEQSCISLGTQIQKEWTIEPKFKCFSYDMKR